MNDIVRYKYEKRVLQLPLTRKNVCYDGSRQQNERGLGLKKIIKNLVLDAEMFSNGSKILRVSTASATIC